MNHQTDTTSSDETSVYGYDSAGYGPRQDGSQDAQGMNWADAWIMLTQELGYTPITADTALNEADTHRLHAIAGQSLYLACDVPHGKGMPASGRYHIEI